MKVSVTQVDLLKRLVTEFGPKLKVPKDQEPELDGLTEWAQSTTHKSIVFQVAADDRYTGPMLHDRFQILETFLRGRYMVVDHTLKTADKVVRDREEIIRFDSIDDAKSFIDFKATGRQPAAETQATRKAVTGGESAASMFRRLILQGDLSDDEIFKQVQAAHGLADNRRSYVDWYRKDLQKKGHAA